MTHTSSTHSYFVSTRFAASNSVTICAMPFVVSANHWVSRAKRELKKRVVKLDWSVLVAVVVARCSSLRLSSWIAFARRGVTLHTWRFEEALDNNVLVSGGPQADVPPHISR